MTPDEEQPLIAGKYRLIRALAAGGMGALWLAEHVELETVVVVKRLLELRDSEADVARFRREAKEAAALRSRHIVRVHDFGTDDDGPYLVMELLRGQDVCSLIEQKGALPVTEAVEIFRQVAKALRVAHQAGVVHRDIKPSNLFLAEEEGEIVVKVLDFGIAKRFVAREGSAAITASGMLLGSPGYMAPEQVRGQRVDSRADIWALGVVLYEMLTNAPPFYSEHVGDTLVRVCAGDFVPATSLNPGLGPAWDDFFAYALEVDPDQRFQSVEVMLHALDLVLSGAPDLHRAFAGAPTLKATSGAVGSLAPSAPDRLERTSSRRASAPLVPGHGPRTLDASQVPISEPAKSKPFQRRLLWLAAGSLLAMAAGWAWMNRPLEPKDSALASPSLSSPSPVSGGQARVADEPMPGAGVNAPPPAGPASSAGMSEKLPAAEGTQAEAQRSQAPGSQLQSSATSTAPTRAAAEPAPRKTKSRPAAPTPTASPLPTAKTPPPSSTPRSSQPKRDPFTGLVTE